MRAASLSDLPEWAGDLLDATPVAHLGLLDEAGRPRVQPITYVRVQGALWSAIDDKPKRKTPARIKRLQDNPNATITVDRYDDDWTKLAWVQVVGVVAVLDLTGHDEVLQALKDRYPAYRERPPKGPLLRLQPELVIWWRASG